MDLLCPEEFRGTRFHPREAPLTPRGKSKVVESTNWITSLLEFLKNAKVWGGKFVPKETRYRQLSVVMPLANHLLPLQISSLT